jgi:hypothetical protein
MSANKRYTANNRQNLQITVNLPDNKGQVTLTFHSGYGLKSEGYYLTNNETIQTALEQDLRFNKSYRLSEINNVPFAEYSARKAIAEKGKKEETEALPVDGFVKPVKELEVKTFPNYLSAKSWLCKNYTVMNYEITSKEILVSKYAEAGFEVKIQKS